MKFDPVFSNGVDLFWKEPVINFCEILRYLEAYIFCLNFEISSFSKKTSHFFLFPCLHLSISTVSWLCFLFYNLIWFFAVWNLIFFFNFISNSFYLLNFSLITLWNIKRGSCAENSISFDCSDELIFDF